MSNTRSGSEPPSRSHHDSDMLPGLASRGGGALWSQAWSRGSRASTWWPKAFLTGPGRAQPEEVTRDHSLQKGLLHCGLSGSGRWGPRQPKPSHGTRLLGNDMHNLKVLRVFFMKGQLKWITCITLGLICKLKYKLTNSLTKW